MKNNSIQRQITVIIELDNLITTTFKQSQLTCGSNTPCNTHCGWEPDITAVLNMPKYFTIKKNYAKKYQDM